MSEDCESGARESSGHDWSAWHDAYADPGSELSRRLSVVRRQIAAWLDSRPGALRVVSACAGRGHDVLGVLATRSDADRVRVTLLEFDTRNVAAARQTARGAGLTGVRVEQADAGDPAAYAGAVPADLVLMVGVFGNIGEDDVERTVVGLPRLCAPDATVIWTRGRRDGDPRPAIRRQLARAGFAEQAFEAPDDASFSVGVHRLVRPPQPLGVGRLFRFEG